LFLKITGAFYWFFPRIMDVESKHPCKP